MGCTEYRLSPQQATRYNKPTHKCCETKQISRQESGSPGPTRSRSPSVAQVLEADTSVALGAQTDGTVESNINSASCTAGRMRTGESVGRQPRSEVVDGEAELLVAGKLELQLWGEYACRSKLTGLRF